MTLQSVISYFFPAPSGYTVCVRLAVEELICARVVSQKSKRALCVCVCACVYVDLRYCDGRRAGHDTGMLCRAVAENVEVLHWILEAHALK